VSAIEMLESFIDKIKINEIIPDNWLIVTFPEAIFFQEGPGLRKYQYRESGIPFLNIRTLVDGRVNHDLCKYLDPEEVSEKYQHFLLQSGDIVASSSGTLGKVAVICEEDLPLMLNTSIIRFRPYANSEPIRDFILWYLKSDHFLLQATKASTGSAQVNFGPSHLKKMYFLLPPLNEQRRIVEKIEALTARSRKAREALEAIPNLLDQFRQSVLAAAFRGDLTADWREQNPDVEPAEVLLERIRVERCERWKESELEKMRAKGKEPQNDQWKEKYKEPNFEEYDFPDELPEGWAGTCIGEIADCLDSVRVPINKDERARREGDIPYYGANGQVGWIDNYLFDEDLVIVVEDETFIGRIKPFSYKITGKSWVNNHAHVLRPLGGMSADFLNFSLMFYPFIPLTSGTTGRRKLTQKSLLAAPYKLPSLQEQKQIVERIEVYFGLADSLQNELENGLSQYETLDQSILAKAFRGELVPQDPNDEPANLLLERIRAERERLGNSKKRGKAKT